MTARVYADGMRPLRPFLAPCAVVLVLAGAGGFALGRASASTSTRTSSAAATVTYECAGTAPDGVRITYGPAGSSYMASRLPFTASAAANGAQSYQIEAFASAGAAAITCDVTVTPRSGAPVIASAGASGGHQLARASICRAGDHWTVC